MGFMNYCIAVTLAMFLAGYWTRHAAQLTAGRLALLLAVYLLMLLTHPVPVAVFLLYAGLYCAAELLRATLSGGALAAVRRARPPAAIWRSCRARRHRPPLAQPLRQTRARCLRPPIRRRRPGLLPGEHGERSATLSAGALHRTRIPRRASAARRNRRYGAARRTLALRLAPVACRPRHRCHQRHLFHAVTRWRRCQSTAVSSSRSDFLSSGLSSCSPPPPPSTRRARWRRPPAPSPSPPPAWCCPCNGQTLPGRSPQMSPVLQSPVAPAGSVGVIVGELPPHPEGFSFDPYFWGGAHYFRRSRAILANAPWLDLPIIMLRPAHPGRWYNLSAWEASQGAVGRGARWRRGAGTQLRRAPAAGGRRHRRSAPGTRLEPAAAEQLRCWESIRARPPVPRLRRRAARAPSSTFNVRATR